jgi:hypothetical protein
LMGEGQGGGEIAYNFDGFPHPPNPLPPGEGEIWR